MSGIITRLAYQKRNKNRVSIFIDEEYAFSLPDVLASSLQVGQHLADDEMARLQAQDARQRAMDKALRLLARRPRSQNEIDEALKKDDFSPNIREQVLARLSEMEYLDDAGFAQWWVDNRVRFNPRSRRALHYELHQKGVSAPIIDEALTGLDDKTLAIAAGSQRLARWSKLDRETFEKKMLSFLQRRGFSYASARFAVDHLYVQVDHPHDND